MVTGTALLLKQEAEVNFGITKRALGWHCTIEYCKWTSVHYKTFKCKVFLNQKHKCYVSHQSSSSSKEEYLISSFGTIMKAGV